MLPSKRHIGKRVARFGFASIHEMVGHYDGYYGVTVGGKLCVVTPAWDDAKRCAIQEDERYGAA